MRVDEAFLVATLADLVGINSINPSLVPGAPGEAAIADHVASVMASLGLEVATHEAAPGRISVVGRLAGTGGGRSLMLNAHLDTVGVEAMADPFAAIVRDGRLYGRGAYDMKGSLAACLTALKALRDEGTPLAGDVYLAAVADEEHASLGTADVLTRYRVDGAIVTEPTELALCLAHKGFAWIDVETRGRAAHGSRFNEGIDANLRMGRFLAALAGLERELRGRAPHPLVGPPSLHAATLAGGSGLSTYADHCRLQIERRTVPGETEEDVLGEITALCDRLRAEDPAYEITARAAFVREPFEARQEGPLVAALAAAAREGLSREPERIGVAFWMDAALYGAAGVETAVIGPIGAGAHAAEEWVDLASCHQVAGILARAATAYCASSQS